MNERVIRCAVVSSDDRFHSLVEGFLRAPERPTEVVVALTETVGDLRTEDVLKLRAVEPEVLFLDIGADTEQALGFTRFLLAEVPALLVVLAGPTLEPTVLLEAMRTGVFEYIPARPDDEALEKALARIETRLLGGESERAATAYAVVSAKGGTGVTTLATNLAVTLAQNTHRPTLLLDLDAQGGTAALLLGLWPRYSFLDLVENFARLDGELLASLIEVHESGVHLLASPMDERSLGSVSDDQGRKLMRFLLRHYDHMVIDIGRAINPLSRAALEWADHTLLVGTAELPTLRNLKRIVPAVQGSDPSRVKLIINRYRATSDISLDEVEETLGLKVGQAIPEDDVALAAAANLGKPVVYDPAIRYSRELFALGSELAGPFADDKRSGLKGALSRLMRGRAKNGKAPSSAAPSTLKTKS